MLKNDHIVIGLDNLSTGNQQNLDRLSKIGSDRYRFIKGDITSIEDVEKCFETRVNIVVNLAAQISVQKSFLDINYNNNVNIDGFVNVLRVSGENKTEQFIYTSSCSVYGDTENLPITENQVPNPLSPYATSKLMNEYLGKNLMHIYPNMDVIGLRLFNLFGPWQDPSGDYAAVIPRWIDLCLQEERPTIFGDGNATRDFCYVENVCEVILDISNRTSDQLTGIYNIGSGKFSSLNNLYECVINSLSSKGVSLNFKEPNYKPWREGDIIHSCASIDLATNTLNFKPKISLEKGINKLLETQYGL